MNCSRKVCIDAPKVFDWVRRRVEVPTIIFDKLTFKDCGQFTMEEWKIKDPCELINNNRTNIECMLTDKEGNPVNPLKKGSINCSSKIVEEGHTLIIKDGKEILLKKVMVVIEGYVVIEILNSYGFTICISNPIPFHVIETFFLCAPEGTESECDVTFFQCESDIVCSEYGRFEELNISIVLCVDVLITSNVKIEVDAESCESRDDLGEELFECPPDHLPPHCPSLFPKKMSS